MELTDSLKAKVRQYQVPPAALAPIRHIPLLFMAGITSAGKNTVLHRLLADYDGQYHFIISHTTRQPRENHGAIEKDGVDYHFVDFATMERMIDQDAFVEVKIVHEEDVYGTSIAEIQDAPQQIAVSDIDIQGVDEYMRLGLQAKAIFLLPPSYEIWRQRLLSRYEGKIDPADLKKRIRSALTELDHALSVDYYYIVINDELSDTVRLVNDIAHNEPVEPHYHKAMRIAESIRDNLRAELQAL